MYTYQLFSQAIESPFLPTGVETSGNLVCPKWNVQNDYETVLDYARNVPRTVPADADFLAIAAVKNCYVLRFIGQATFVVDVNRKQITYCCEAGRTIATAAHLFITHVFPRCMIWLGNLPLHASAVADDNRSLAFVGPSGIGKSTIAYALQNRHYRFVSDDGVLLSAENVQRILPNPSVSRLWEESCGALAIPDCNTKPSQRAGKYHVHVDTVTDNIPLLAAVYVLEPVSAETPITINPLTSAEATVELVRATLRLDRSSKHETLATFDMMMQLIRRTAICRVRVPRSYAHLEAVCTAIEKHAATLHESVKD